MFTKNKLLPQTTDAFFRVVIHLFATRTNPTNPSINTAPNNAAANA